MDRYVLEARGRADELLDLLGPETIEVVRGWLTISSEPELWREIVILSPRVRTLLAHTPAKDRHWLETTPRPTFVREWLAARYWAIAAARALAVAADLSDVPGLPYRKAVPRAARTAYEFLELPSADDVLTLRLLS